MSEIGEALEQATNLDNLVICYEICMDERIDEARSWLDDPELVPARSENYFQESLLADDLNASNLLKATRTNVENVTLTFANQLTGVKDFPPEAAKALRNSRRFPTLQAGHEYLHGWTDDSKLLDALEAGYDHMVMRHAFRTDELSEGKRHIIDYASRFAREAIEMAYDERVYREANGSSRFDQGWKMLNGTISTAPTGEAARKGFDRHAFEAARSAKTAEAAQLIIDLCVSGPEDRRRQMADNLKSNVMILPLVLKSQRLSEAMDSSEEVSDKPDAQVIDMSRRSRRWYNRRPN